MGFSIESGNGNGQQVGVKNNRLDVSAKTNGRATYVAREDGQCYFFTHSYNYGAGDTILWLTNTSTTKNLHIEKIHVAGDTATLFTIHCPLYVAPSGSSITGTNSNRTSGNSADAVCIGDEVNNSQANILIKDILIANSSKNFPVDGKIILGYHDCLAVDFTTVGALAAVSFVGYYEDN